MSRIMVKATASGNLIGVKTVTRERKSQQFLFTRDELGRISPEGPLYSRDGYSYASVRPCGDELRMDFTWLAHRGGDAVAGYREEVYIDMAGFLDFVERSRHPRGPETWKVLARDMTLRCPRITFRCPDTLKRIAASPVLRHKLAVALRDNFQWPGSDEVVLFRDWDPYSFFFREYANGIEGINGGLILHGQEDMGKARYSIHT